MLTSAFASDLVNAHHHSDHVAVVTLSRPQKRNALSNEMLGDLARIMVALEQDETTRCVILIGDSNFFSAGADINEMREHGIAAIDNRARMQAWHALETLRIPVVAAVSGICFGGGHELAMLCDVIVASETAQFGQPEIKLGHIPGDGGTQRVIRAVGKYVAMQMILTGEPLSAQEALRVGLVAEVAPDCVARSLEIAELIARHSPQALALAKDAVLSAQDNSLSEGLKVERRNITQAFTTRDQKEGLAAFFEKRAPKYTNS